MSQEAHGEDTPKTEVDTTTETNDVAEATTAETTPDAGDDQSGVIQKGEHKVIKKRIVDGYKKEIAEREARIAELERQQEEARQKDLEEKEKYKELYEEQKEKLAKESESKRQMAIEQAVQSELSKHPWQNPKVAKSLVDMSKVTVSDTGEVSGVTDQVEDILKENPYLLRKEVKGVNAQAVAQPSSRKETSEEAMPYTPQELDDIQAKIATNPRWYVRNKADIEPRLKATKNQ